MSDGWCDLCNTTHLYSCADVTALENKVARAEAAADLLRVYSARSYRAGQIERAEVLEEALSILRSALDGR